MLNSQSNLYRTEWLDLVFKNRNKAYGAYILRAESSKNTLRALFIAAPVFILTFVLPQVLGHVTPDSPDAIVDKVVDVQDFTAPPLKRLPPKPIAPQPAPVPEKVKTVKLTAKIQVVDEPLSSDEMPTLEEIKESAIGQEAQSGTTNTSQVANTGVVQAGTGTSEVPVADNAIRETVSLDRYPEFEGGMQAWAKYIQRNLRYPLQAQEDGIQGKVFISFVIEKDGSISNVTVLRGVASSLDQEAARVIQKSPKWKPGIQNKQSVRVRYNMPISFSLAQ
jgi:protein TonB